MKNLVVEDKSLEGLDYSNKGLEIGIYDNCRFVQCNMAAINLTNINFVDCEFMDCDLSNAKIANTAFKDVKFKQCKMLGLHFKNANPFLLALDFEDCQLQLASFYQLNLKGISFRNCNLQEVDFAEADLSSGVFENCDLQGAIFERSNLEKSDFRTAFNYVIDLEENRVKKAQFSKDGIAGLLRKYGVLVE